MHIGLIGGIGVAATVVYYQRLTAEMTRRGKPLSLTISHADVQTLIANNNADKRDAQAEVYRTHLEALKGAGCDCAAITSLGGHFCFEETAALSPLPLISAVEPLDDYFAEQGFARVGLLGTRVVMRTKLYGQLERTQAVTLDQEIESLGQAYLEMAVSGVASDEQRSLFLDAGRRLVVNTGADAVVLAGTDLNLAFDGMNPGYTVVDALDVHVARLADLAT